MSEQNKKIKIIEKSEELAASGRVPEAIEILRSYFSDEKDNHNLQRLEELDSNYRRMSDYFLTGNPDSFRNALHSKTVGCLLTLASDCRCDLRISEGNDLFATKARFEQLQGHTLAERLDDYRRSVLNMTRALIDSPEKIESLRNSRDTRLSLLFYKLWTVRIIEENDLKRLRQILLDPEEDFTAGAQIINALLLRCMEFFDYNVILFLADITESTSSEKLAARAMTALILLMTHHRKKIDNNHAIKERFLLWEDNLLIYCRLREVVTALIRTRDTDRISDTMKSEIIPGLSKISPEIMKKMRDSASDFEPASLEENPEWEEMLNKSGLSDKLRELSELQTEGADVMMVAFSNLKNFPFFMDTANWLLPFDIGHSSLEPLRRLNLNGIETLFSSPAIMMCDSDKYSFAFSLMSMPTAQRDMALGQLDAQIEQLTADHQEKLLKSSMPDFERETNMYVRDLYRFYKLNPRKNEFANPFGNVAEFTRLPAIGQLLMKSDIIDIAAEFLLRHGYYQEALGVFRDIEKHRENDSNRCEKIGFCLQKLGDYEAALSYYDKAALLAPESKWLMKKRAFCNRMTGNFKEASALYTTLLESEPENLNMICSLGDCLAAENDISGSLKQYYKADYIHPDNKKVERAIAWNEMLSRHYDKGRLYYEKLLSHGDANGRDFINAGHNAFLNGNPREAYELYTAARKLYKTSKEFHDALESDMEMLIENGAAPMDVRIMFNTTY